MKKKELKKLAQKLAEAELIIEANESQDKVQQAKKQVIELTGSIKDFQDLDLLDEMIQEILKKS